MTLDEARECLSVPRGASVEQVQEAFRSKARLVHPDRHPDAPDAERALLSQEFDRARRARDALVGWARQSASTATAPPAAHPAPSPPPPKSPADPPPRERARPRTSETRRPAPEPERVTMRFDEFVAWTDAAGFGVGQRTRPYTDWPRIVAWSTIGVLVGGLAVASALAGTGVLTAGVG